MKDVWVLKMYNGLWRGRLRSNEDPKVRFWDRLVRSLRIEGFLGASRQGMFEIELKILSQLIQVGSFDRRVGFKSVSFRGRSNKLVVKAVVTAKVVARIVVHALRIHIQRGLNVIAQLLQEPGLEYVRGGR